MPSFLLLLAAVLLESSVGVSFLVPPAARLPSRMPVRTQPGVLRVRRWRARGMPVHVVSYTRSLFLS